MRSRGFKTVLVAIRDIEKPSRSLLAKAARIADRFGAKLELLHVIATPYVVPGDSSTGATIKESEVRHQLMKLQRIANRLAKAGIKVASTVTWDYPASDAIVRHVFKTKPDVVMAESHHHGKLARWFIGHTDWELIRSCPCPLWLVRKSKVPDKFRALAAIDPFHAHAKPAALDEEILRTARDIVAEKGRVGTVHVYPVPITMIAGGMGEPIWVEASSAEQRRVRQRIAAATQSLANRFGIAKADQLVQSGDVGTELPVLAKSWKADVLVMGAVSRSAFKRAFIGSTAEGVIDAAHCDVVIVKPRAFKSPVRRTASAAIVPVPPM
jgi:universal stress protein E